MLTRVRVPIYCNHSHKCLLPLFIPDCEKKEYHIVINDATITCQNVK